MYYMMLWTEDNFQQSSRFLTLGLVVNRSFNNAWQSKQILESLKTTDKLATAASFQTEICRVLIIVFQQLLLGDTLELNHVIRQWRKALGDTSSEQQFCSKGFFERLSSVIEELHTDTKIQWHNWQIHFRSVGQRQFWHFIYWKH